MSEPWSFGTIRANFSRPRELVFIASARSQTKPPSSNIQSHFRSASSASATPSSKSSMPVIGRSPERILPSRGTFVRTWVPGCSSSHISPSRHAIPVFPDLGRPVIVRYPPSPLNGPRKYAGLNRDHGNESPSERGGTDAPTMLNGSREHHFRSEEHTPELQSR